MNYNLFMDASLVINSRIQGEALIQKKRFGRLGGMSMGSYASQRDEGFVSVNHSKVVRKPQTRRFFIRTVRGCNSRPMNFIHPIYSSTSSFSFSDHVVKFDKFPFQSSFLNHIHPYLLAEWQPILNGWISSVISVYCLSRAVPTIGNLSTSFAQTQSESWIREGLMLSVLLLVRSTVNYWQQAFLWEAALKCASRIRIFVFDRVLKRDLQFFEGSGVISTGDIAYRITAEAADVADTIYALLNTVVPNALQLFAMALQMFVASPVLSLISIMIIPCMSLVIAYLGQRLRKISRKAHISVAQLSAYLNEVLPSALVVKANNAELCENSRFQRLVHDDLDATLKKKRMKGLIPQVLQILYMGALLTFCAGCIIVSNGSFDRSCVVSFLTSLVLLIEPIQGVGKAYNELKLGEPAMERLFDLTKFNSQVIERPDGLDIGTVLGDVKFCGITFKYGENMPLVLNEINLQIKPGETIALVGPSGGGKTTLTKLLLRLYDPQSGCILVDDNDIRDIRLDSLRRHVALVPQDATLFPGTVAENIGYRDLMRGINMARVQHAAELANADDFIGTLPQRYKTDIGQRGSLLSGGQKQRLAIARALYQNASILILDEATSALDNRSELLVRQALERLMTNRTVLIIAHRLETVKMANRIVLLEGGKLKDITCSFHSQGGINGSLLSGGLVI